MKKFTNDTNKKSEERPNKLRRKNCYSMYEATKMFDVSEWTIRLWVDRFNILKPRCNRNDVLFFTPAEIDKIEIICRLSQEKGMTVEKVREYLKD